MLSFDPGLQQISRSQSQLAPNSAGDDNLPLCRNCCMHGKTILPQTKFESFIPRLDPMRSANSRPLASRPCDEHRVLNVAPASRRPVLQPQFRQEQSHEGGHPECNPARLYISRGLRGRGTQRGIYFSAPPCFSAPLPNWPEQPPRPARIHIGTPTRLVSGLPQGG